MRPSRRRRRRRKTPRRRPPTSDHVTPPRLVSAADSEVFGVRFQLFYYGFHMANVLVYSTVTTSIITPVQRATVPYVYCDMYWCNNISVLYSPRIKYSRESAALDLLLLYDLADATEAQAQRCAATLRGATPPPPDPAVLFSEGAEVITLHIYRSSLTIPVTGI